MFPEYREQITQLRISDLNFVRLYEKHNALDQKIRHMEAHIEPSTHEEIEQLKKEKLLTKDALYSILKKTVSTGQ
ncbi:MAG: YdcH family protein [Rhodoferax sp.]|uniref:YdcH family protein n=1 Tax=Rhodoferax sp. TaxID=50421 RepID=UPI003BB521AE